MLWPIRKMKYNLSVKYIIFCAKYVTKVGAAVLEVPNISSIRCYEPASQSRSCSEGEAR